MVNGVLRRLTVLVSVTALVLSMVPALAAPTTTPPVSHEVPPLHREASPQDAIRFAAHQQGLTLDPVPTHASATLSDALLRLYHVANIQEQVTQEQVTEFTSTLDPRLRAEITPLVDALATATTLRDDAFQNEELLSIAPMAQASILLLDTVEVQTPHLQDLPTTVWPSATTADPVGIVAIGTPQSDTYTKIRWLQVDPAGEDYFYNNAGGADTWVYAGGPISAALSLDLGGDDVYQTDGWYVQGSGHRAVGVLVDEQGNDSYEAGSEVQGSGGNGVGILWDKAGNDSYTSHDNEGQGYAAVGIGLLQDDGGNDSYWASGYSMGTGSTLGVGMLRDLGGDDVYDGDTFTVAGFGRDLGRGYFFDYGFGNDSYIFYKNTFASNNDSWTRQTDFVLPGYGYGWDGGEPATEEFVIGVTGGTDLGYG